MWKLALVALVACVPPGPSARPVATAPGASQIIPGELRPGDDRCSNLCDHHTLAWATAGRVHLELEAPDLQIFLSATGPHGETHGDFGHTSSLDLDVEPNVDYDVTVNAYNYYEHGPYKLEISPPPARTRLAEERPLPVPPTPEEAEPEPTLPAKIAEVTKGYKWLGPAVHGDLGKVPTMKWSARRGQCYLAVVVFEAGARKTDDWYTMSAKLITSSESRSTSGGFVTGSQRILTVGGTGDILCPSRDGSLTIAFEHHAKMVPLANAGKGPFRVELYAKAIAGKTLDERDQNDDHDYCRSCMQQRATCQRTGDSGGAKTCAAQFASCLYQGGMSAGSCQP